jgi:hypothetical protein
VDISSIASIYRTQPVLQISSVSATDPSQTALATATARLVQQQQTTSVQISAYGKVAAGFSQVEDTGKALATAKSTTEVVDTRKALLALVAAYNDTRTAAAGTDPGNARIAANNLLSAVSSDTSHADLTTLGISQQKDGSLTLDTKLLDSALQSDPESVHAAAARIGGQLQQTAILVLASNGGIGSSLKTLNARALKNSETQQSIASASQQMVQQQSYGVSNSLSGANNLYGANSTYGANSLSSMNNLSGMSYLYSSGGYYGPGNLYGISSYQNISSLFNP